MSEENRERLKLKEQQKNPGRPEQRLGTSGYRLARQWLSGEYHFDPDGFGCGFTIPSVFAVEGE